MQDNLYHYDGFADGVTGFDSVTETEIKNFMECGYIIVHEAFSAEQINGAIDGLVDMLAVRDPVVELAHKPDNNPYKGGEGRLEVRYEPIVNRGDLKGMAPREQLDYVRKLMWIVGHDQRLRALSSDPKMNRVVGKIIGDNPLLMQDMALLKPPRIGREKPWHQDHAYFDIHLDTPVVGVWIALDRATVDNGCMIIKPGSNQLGPVVHFQRRDWQICDTHIESHGSLATPLEPGGCIIFSSLLQHGSAPNVSNQRRRALQFHYMPAGTRFITPKDRMDVFGDEGKDVSC